jgi:hypothetical protein
VRQLVTTATAGTKRNRVSQVEGLRRSQPLALQPTARATPDFKETQVYKHLRISAIALMTTALTVAPAAALSINLGGDGPLLDLGNSNNQGATLSVDTNAVLGSGGTSSSAGVEVNLGKVTGTGTGGLLGLGTEGKLLDLGGSNGLIDFNGDGPLLNLGSDTDAAVINLGTSGKLLDLGGANGLIDFNGEGPLLNLGSDPDAAVINLGSEGNLLDLGNEGFLLDFGEGGLLDLGGNGDATVDVALLGENGLLDFDSSGSLAGLGLDGLNDLLDLGTTGSIVDLGTTGSLIDLGGSGGLLDLGNGELLNLGGDGEPLLEFGEDPTVALNLLGTNVDIQLGGKNKPLAKVKVGVDDDGLAGTGLLGGTNATISVGGGSGSGGGDGPDTPNNPNNPNNPGGGKGGGAGNSLTASADACLSLTEAQLRELVNRHAYTQATFRSWAGTNSLKIVPVDLCEGVVSKVSMTVGGDANIARLQAFVGAQAKVRAGLASQGYSPSDVIAADRDGQVLILYVI